MLSNWWIQAVFWDKVFLIYGVVCVLFILGCMTGYFTEDNVIKKLDFIKNAQEENRIVIGKISCFTLHYKKGMRDHYEAEYMYMVDNKSYYVTYKMALGIPEATSMEYMDADVELTSVKPFVIFYYDKKDPSKVLMKTEVFVSKGRLSKTSTLRNNIYRDVGKQWVEAIEVK